MKLERKNKGLLLGFVAALYVCYTLAISKTIETYYLYTAQQAQLQHQDYNPDFEKALLKKQKQLDAILSVNPRTSKSFQNDLLKHLNKLCVTHRLKIAEFKEPHRHTENNTIVTTYVFKLEGSYNGALGLISQIEKNEAFGNVNHVSFQKIKDYKINSERLFIEVMLQKIQN